MDIGEYVALLLDIAEYAEHKEDCDAWIDSYQDVCVTALCNCGLNELMDRLVTEELRKDRERNQNGH